jgi:hypothetical protein
MRRTNVIDEELHIGTVSVFAAVGLSEVNQPTLRRVGQRRSTSHRHACLGEGVGKGTRIWPAAATEGPCRSLRQYAERLVTTIPL